VSFRQLASEFIGTFILCFFTLWTRICVDLFKVDYVEVALTTGLCLMLLVSLGDTLSNGCFNPALSIAAFLIGKLSFWRCVSCMMVQFLAGFLAASVVVFTASNMVIEKVKDFSKLGLPMMGTDYSQLESFAAEFCATTFLTFVYIRVKSGDDIAPQLKGICLGGAMVVCICTFYTVSGGCYNPALIFGPSFLVRYIALYQWVYYFGPFLGAIIASAIYIIYRNIIDGKVDNEGLKIYERKSEFDFTMVRKEDYEKQKKAENGEQEIVTEKK